MPNQYLKVSMQTAWGLALAQFILFSLSLASWLNIIDFEPSSLNSLFVMLSAVITIVFANDMIANKIINRWFWVFSLIVLNTITPIVYLIQRKKLIRLGEKLK
jgi:hypothetical protein